jgi:hypothetical protein
MSWCEKQEISYVEVPSCYGIRNFIKVLTQARRLILLWVAWIHSALHYLNIYFGITFQSAPRSSRQTILFRFACATGPTHLTVLDLAKCDVALNFKRDFL